ncbi:MAG: hypothetical protein R2797_04715 [Gelidibacter sp.]
MLDAKIQNALKSFFLSTDMLIDKEIIRSSKYTADIAEYLSEKIYGLTLCDSQREPGYEGWDIDNKKYQIKINNSKKKTNQDIGNPELYDFLILLITSNSKLYNRQESNHFIVVYKISSSALKDQKYIAKKDILQLVPDYFISLNFDIIKNKTNTLKSK